MPKITSAEYDELLQLRQLHNLDSQLASVKRLQNLEYDIDTPIKSVVAMLALLGCQPIWSCCGFDYAQQPYHKSHQYGTCGVALLDDAAVIKLQEYFTSADLPYQNMVNRWQFQRGSCYDDKICYLRSDIVTNNTWPAKDSIHYSEPGTIALGILKTFLVSLQSEMQTNCVLRDYNHVYKSRYPDWQYPPLEDWLIQRDAIVSNVYAI